MEKAVVYSAAQSLVAGLDISCAVLGHQLRRAGKTMQVANLGHDGRGRQQMQVIVSAKNGIIKEGHSDSLMPQPRSKSAVAQIFDSY